MSLKIIKDQIFDFLSSEKPEVLAIKGDWGVGKTFSWNEFLKEARDKKQVQLERYSYVSLFGIDSLKAFKYELFQNVVKRDLIGTEVNVETFKNNTNSLIESMGRQSLNFLKGAPLVKSFSRSIEAISFLSLNHTIVCIDDLERKGDGLSIKDILGLVSLLKEQKKCKIVLLLNDEKGDVEGYQDYREKVVDIELAFAPNPDECASIAYPDNASYSERLKELTISLGIRNIRVLKKIERLILLSLPLVDEFESEVSDQLIHTLVLYCWSYFSASSNPEVPPLNFITNGMSRLVGSDEEESDQEAKWKTTLQGFNYWRADELDFVLFNAVKTGFFVPGELKDKAKHRNREILASKSEGAFTEAWSQYHNSFDNNGEAVVDGIYQSAKTNCKHISPSNLDGTISFLRGLGEDQKASEIIDTYIETRSDEVDVFNIEAIDFFGRTFDEEIVKKFHKALEKLGVVESAEDVLNRIAGRSGWNSSDEVVLANTSIDDYYTLFKSINGPDLSSMVSTCLKFGQYSNPSDQHKQISERAEAALKRIAGESEINRVRVKRFGVVTVSKDNAPSQGIIEKR